MIEALKFAKGYVEGEVSEEVREQLFMEMNDLMCELRTPDATWPSMDIPDSSMSIMVGAATSILADTREGGFGTDVEL